MLMYVFTGILSRVKAVRNSSDELNFLPNLSTFSTQHPHPTFLLLLPAAMRIDTKHTTSLYLPDHCIHRPHDLLYALVGLAKVKAETETKTETETKAKRKAKAETEQAVWRPPQQCYVLQACHRAFNRLTTLLTE